MRRPGPRTGARFALVLTVAVVLTACGDDGDGGSGAAATTRATTATTRAATATTATTAATTTTAGAAEIVTLDFSFEGLTVAANRPITVVNRGQAPHTVTAVDGSFDVEVAAGQRGQLAALAPGTYQIRCRFHATSRNMVGTLTVR